ncbi:hypothetical protein ACLOJK_013543 [Asimina triloba]
MDQYYPTHMKVKLGRVYLFLKACLDQIKLTKDHSIAQGRPVPMSGEELKVRNELEIEVEKDLEEEIKDGICRLALRLHRLYQHQKEIRGPGFSSMNGNKNQTNAFVGVVTEVNISIRIEADSKMEVSESNKEISNQRRIEKVKVEGEHGKRLKMGVSSCKEFDWVRTLRSSGSSSSVAIAKKNNKGSRQDSESSSCRAISQRGRNRNFINEWDERKKREMKLLESGWRT